MSDLLTDEHRAALSWFEANADGVMGWPKALANGQLLAAKAKGIYKPAGWDHALSIRLAASGGYADEERQVIGPGKWQFQYHQEERSNGGDPRTFATNRGLERCMKDGVPVGIMRQLRPKPDVTYEIWGLGHVTAWEGKFFTLVGPAALGGAMAPAPVEPAPPTSVEDAREAVMRAIYQRRGQGRFRQQLLIAYGGRCAISGCDVAAVLEAAHIVPYLGEHTNAVSNGLLLRADLHTLFDLDLLRIDATSMAVVIADPLLGSEYGALHGVKVRLPHDRTHAPPRANFETRATLLAEG